MAAQENHEGHVVFTLHLIPSVSTGTHPAIFEWLCHALKICQ